MLRQNCCLKLRDSPDGTCVYMTINKFFPDLYVNDPGYPGAEGMCRNQKVNCHDEYFSQPDGSAAAVRLHALDDLYGTNPR